MIYFGRGGMPVRDSGMGDLIGIAVGIVFLITASLWWNRMLRKD
jgi:hypothetical protein